jgi:acyl carrier protein
MSIKEQVNNILKEIKPTKDLANIDDIIESGYLDSFELMSLIASLSDTFNIEIDVDEIVPENFNSAAAIVAMVERLAK